MTGVLIKRQNLDTHKHTERMKAETTSQGIPKTASKPPKLRDIRNSYNPQKEATLPIQHLDLELQAVRTVNQIHTAQATKLVLSYHSCPIIAIHIYFCFIDYTKAFDCVDHNKLWKILQEMGIPDHLTCLFRNLYADQEATVRTGLGPTDWFQIGKGVHQGCILSPCLFNLYGESTS